MSKSGLVPEVRLSNCLLDELDDRLLGPAAVIAGWIGEKSAVAAVGGLDVADCRVRKELLPRRGQHSDEGIIQRMQKERGHADLVQGARRTGPVVVIVSAGEALVEGCPLSSNSRMLA
jgi:hypothetical protein